MHQLDIKQYSHAVSKVCHGRLAGAQESRGKWEIFTTGGKKSREPGQRKMMERSLRHASTDSGLRRPKGAPTPLLQNPNWGGPVRFNGTLRDAPTTRNNHHLGNSSSQEVMRIMSSPLCLPNLPLVSALPSVNGQWQTRRGTSRLHRPHLHTTHQFGVNGYHIL
jgi:hypothetical protein